MWSVGKLNCCNPLRYLTNFSQAHTDARNSFSICAYLVSAGFNVIDAKVTGFFMLLSSCQRTAPRL